MTAAPFVPLSIATAPAPRASFQPATPKTSAPPPAAKQHETHGEPKVTFERQGETITHIRVECGCGQVIELKCQY